MWNICQWRTRGGNVYATHARAELACACCWCSQVYSHANLHVCAGTGRCACASCGWHSHLQVHAGLLQQCANLALPQRHFFFGQPVLVGGAAVLKHAFVHERPLRYLVLRTQHELLRHLLILARVLLWREDVIGPRYHGLPSMPSIEQLVAEALRKRACMHHARDNTCT